MADDAGRCLNCEVEKKMEDGRPKLEVFASGFQLICYIFLGFVKLTIFVVHSSSFSNDAFRKYSHE